MDTSIKEMDSLPLELKEKIFTTFEVFEIKDISTLQLISKETYNICSTDRFWRVILQKKYLVIARKNYRKKVMKNHSISVIKDCSENQLSRQVDVLLDLVGVPKIMEWIRRAISTVSANISDVSEQYDDVKRIELRIFELLTEKIMVSKKFDDMEEMIRIDRIYNRCGLIGFVFNTLVSKGDLDMWKWFLERDGFSILCDLRRLVGMWNDIVPSCEWYDLFIDFLKKNKEKILSEVFCVISLHLFDDPEELAKFERFMESL
jgi:hypothetical protein